MNLQYFKQKNKLKIVGVILIFFSVGVVSLSAQSPGDVNSDGAINIVDALLVAQEYVGLQPANFNSAYADVDGNGQISIIDALLIAQYYVGLIDSFPGSTSTSEPTAPPAVTPEPTSEPGGEEPKAKFDISNITPSVNEVVTFDASESSDPDGTIVSYEWDFKDGTTGTGKTITHSFAEIDDYNVVLLVTDNDGNTDDKKNRVFVGRPDGWTEDTHHKSADPDYDTLFPEDTVNRIDITISPTEFQRMEDDLAGKNMWSDVDPIFVPVTIELDGYTWWHVGMRYKGQSSLYSASQSGSHKYPFRLDFDEFEDDYPEIDDQRFYGFKKMTFCNNWSDSSFLREKVCADILREGGVPAARGAFYRVFIDTGDGSVYWGLYTMVEDPNGKLLEVQFEDDSGNLYKPEGDGADWTQPFRQEAFIKKTNEDLMDWSDVQGAHTALHASRTDQAAWRNGLDTYLNTTRFLRWLAINTAVVNWDSYGTLAQNYYIYQDLSDNGRLVWITWDHNLSMTSSSMMGNALSLSLDEVGNNWPLIRFLMDDPVYNDVYHQEMETAMNGCFDGDTVIARIQHFHDLIKPYVVGAEGEINGYTFLSGGESAFIQARDELINHVRTRQTDVMNYLNSR